MANIKAFYNLRQEVLLLYLYEVTSCDGMLSTRLKSLGKICQMIETIEDKAVKSDGQIERLTAENGELMRQIEALKKQEKKMEKEPAHKAAENTCDDFMKEVDDFMNSLLSIFGSLPGSEEKK